MQQQQQQQRQQSSRLDCRRYKPMLGSKSSRLATHPVTPEENAFLDGCISPIDRLHVMYHDNSNDADSEILTMAEEESVRFQNESTWQEEAHWMSFRNAVQQLVASRQIAKNIIETNKEDGHNGQRDFDPWSLHQSRDDDDEEDSGVLVGVPRHVMLLKSPTDFTLNSNNSGQHLDDSNSSSMASDLAETKMRLALAQAERDELEYALIILQPSKLR
jgi:hypothetical protein